MQTGFLYALTVLIWGSTWLAIEYQLGSVAPQVSLFYRFAIAAVLMWALCFIKGAKVKFALKDHGFFLVQGVCIFSLNYVLLYWSQGYLTSAMACIAFSTLMLMNIVNARLFFKQIIMPRIYIGAGLGITGIVALYWYDVKDLDFNSGAMIGLGLALTGTFIASMGNMASIRNGRQKISLYSSNSWGMTYGTILLAGYALFSGAEWTFDTGMPYVLSLLHLSVSGTVVAFACYFALFNRIGAEKTSYANVLFPVVAVILSTFFEGFVWHENTVLGFILVMLGNVVVLTPGARVQQWLRSLQKRSTHSQASST